jgi:DUF1680 family protein
LGSIRPEGWLKDQLRIQADGLTGHLDEFWPDVRDSGWIGGNAEGWERMPYWLDGAVPLAYQMDDAKLKARVTEYIDYILVHQQEDGWLGPEKSPKGNYKPRDPWPVFVAMKVLTQYQEATGDPRVVPVLRRYLRCLSGQLEKRPLFDWNRMRWQDGVLSVYWLHERTGERWLLDLAGTLERQGYNWKTHFEDLPFKQKVDRWQHESHVVNNAMGAKAPAVAYRLSGDSADRQAAYAALEMLDRYHGQATGMFTGDECFAGKMPSQGTETCAVVEFLFSLEMLASLLGDAVFGDRLEQVAFNALPAPFKPDMWARQYDQQANQPVVKAGKEKVFTTNSPTAHLYGLETNYGCCTANMHQGWPKLVSHLWMKTPDDGLAVVAYAPATISTELKDVRVIVKVSTEYPFEERIAMDVSTEKPVEFPIRLRVPAWAEGARLTVAGETPVTPPAGGYHTVRRKWSGVTSLQLRMPMQIRIENRYNNAVAVHRGPLVYSLEIGTEWKQVGGTPPHATWEVHPTTSWNYALEVDRKQPGRSFTVVPGGVKGSPFGPRGTFPRLQARGRRLPGWTLENNAAAPPPESPVESQGPLETLHLIPYGAAKLRITEFPVLKG